jgi:hypothetical protein
MDMNDLNKNQLILLALLVSFVTSIATGIVTVALMEQAPPGVTQTINRVVEKTVQVVQPKTETQVVTEQVVVREGDLVADAVQMNMGGLVSFYVLDANNTQQEIGSGFLVTPDGLVSTDIDIVSRMSAGAGVFAVYKDVSFTVRLVSYDMERYVGIVQLDDRIDREVISEDFFTPLTLTTKNTSLLGSSVVAIDATHNVQIRLGMITRLEYAELLQEDGSTVSGDMSFVHTDILIPTSVNGGPLVLLDGSVVGSAFISKEGVLYAVPSAVIRDMLDIIAQQGLETVMLNTSQSASALQGFSRNIGVLETTQQSQKQVVDGTQ